jgi:MFS family permease
MPPPDNTNVGGGRRRRSSLLSEISQDLAEEMRRVNERLHSHTMSTLALCSCVLTMFYTIFNCFPYSGFMAMQLVDGLTHETAGTYAGILSSSFMIGRAFSSYAWGKLADIYGRKLVLIISLVNSALFSIAFGFSPTFSWAIGSRFFMGLGNGIMLIARTSSSELARGDRELESRSMGLIMSMVGYGMLIGPAVGGALSEPMKQYPEAQQSWFHGKFDGVLTKFPFVLPNLVSVILCFLSLIFVILSVEETLPDDERRDVRHLIPDACLYISQAPVNIWKSLSGRRNQYQRVAHTVPSHHEDNNTIEDDLEILEKKDFSELSALLSSGQGRASYSSAMRRPSAVTIESNSAESKKSATVSSLLSNKNTRDHLVAYWLNGFINVGLNEAFPLFAMSLAGGLGFTEIEIGYVLTGAGLLFCICQYFIFSHFMKTFGLHKSLIYGSFLSNVPAILFPVSLLTHGWVRLAFLIFLMAFLMVFNSVFYAGITIATNRTVEASHRATLNGLSAVGASIGRGLGPLVAGSLVAFSMTSQSIIDPTFGSVLVYTVLTAGGTVAFAATYHLSEEEDMTIPPTSRMSPDKKNSNGGIEIEGINKTLTKNEE